MSTPIGARNQIAVLNRDVFFGVRLKQLGYELGYVVAIVPDAAAFLELLRAAETVLGIVDINAAPDWDVLTNGIGGNLIPPILAFGPHLDVEGLRAARAAGVTRVVSNGTFHRDAATLIPRYAGTQRDLATVEDEENDERP